MAILSNICGSNQLKTTNRNRFLLVSVTFYAQKQLLLSARLSRRNSVCPSVCHMSGSVKNGARWDHKIFTMLHGRLWF